jgi:class 3 adenylate cyclase
MTTPPETQYATASDGLKIAYQVTGNGDVDLVFMQGAVAHLDLAWEDPRLSRLFDRLSSFSRLVRFDRRGMGMSGVTDRPSTLEEQVADFATVMDATGTDRAALFGTIDAGTIALAFAAEHPDRTAAVIAFETAPRWTRTEEDDFGVEPAVLARFAEATQAMDVEGQLSIVAPSRKDDPAFRSWFRRYTRSAQSGIPIQVVMMVMMAWDIRDRLPDVRAPVLVLNRAEQAILPVRNARALAAALPNATLVELPGRDTAIFSSDVDAVADEIETFLTGSRPPPRHDRVLATVLFTDIVGSTERAASMGDRDWRELLERHHRLLRAELDRYGGQEVHTAGDGFLATFDSPRRAIECAMSAGRAIRSIGLDIRAGVHTGELERSGGDVQGIAVHIGARIAALASAGEVFVSSTVKDLVIGSGIEFEDRGEHSLRGVPDAWRVFSVASS